MNRPRLLILTPSFRPEVGGVETRLDDLCAFLKRHGYPTHVLTYQPIISGGRGLPREQDGSLSVRRLPWPGGNWFHRLLRFPALEVAYLVPGLLAGALWHLARHHRDVDTVHTLGLNCAIIGRLLKPLFRKRWIVSTHAIYDFVPGSRFARVSGWVLRGADHVVALSDASRRELLAIGLDPARVSTQLTWVNQERFRPGVPAEARRQLGLPERFTVLFVGRLLAIKGASVLLEIARRQPAITFAFVGHGDEEAALREAARQLPNVRFFGSVENARLAPYYQAADVFAMPSQYSEGLGRVALEALSCGVPVICTSRGGLAEHVTPAVALAVEPTAANIEQAILSLVQDPARLETMRRACRTFAEQTFGEANAEALARIYAGDMPARTT